MHLFPTTCRPNQPFLALSGVSHPRTFPPFSIHPFLPQTFTNHRLLLNDSLNSPSFILTNTIFHKLSSLPQFHFYPSFIYLNCSHPPRPFLAFHWTYLNVHRSKTLGPFQPAENTPNNITFPINWIKRKIIVYFEFWGKIARKKSFCYSSTVEASA